jgi:hypothetical protein
MAAQKICLGVEINQDGLKIALVEPEHKNVIKIDAIPASGDSMKDASIYSSVMTSWTHSNSLPEIISVAVAFPVHSGIMRLVDIPKEAEHPFGYIEWEFASAINSSARDYRLDAAYYPSSKKPARAIVTALRKEIVDSFCSKEVERSGFRPNCLIADICALLNLLECSEGLSSQPICVLKADEKFAVAFWGNETGPLAIRLFPKEFLSPNTIVEFLDKGYKEFPKAKRKVKFCGELSANAKFADELVNAAMNPKEAIEIEVWKSLSKFSMGKDVDSSKLSRCLGAIGATLNCT